MPGATKLKKKILIQPRRSAITIYSTGLQHIHSDAKTFLVSLNLQTFVNDFVIHDAQNLQYTRYRI